jgi:hypothetical protein
MSDMKRLIEAVDKATTEGSTKAAEKRSTGPNFPGYWKGKDPASKAKSKMVGGCEESIIKELAKEAKERKIEWQLAEAYREFTEASEEELAHDERVKRLRQKAKAGPGKTVWDPNTRKYKVVFGDEPQPKKQDQEVKEAKSLLKKVRIVGGPEDCRGKIGTIGEIRNGQFKGAPKTYTVDYETDDGRMTSVQLPATALRLVKEPADDAVLGEYGNAQNPNQQATNPTQQSSGANNEPDSNQDTGVADPANLKTDAARDIAGAKNLAALKTTNPAINPEIAGKAIDKLAANKPISGAEMNQTKALADIASDIIQTPQGQQLITLARQAQSQQPKQAQVQPAQQQQQKQK